MWPQKANLMAGRFLLPSEKKFLARRVVGGETVHCHRSIAKALQTLVGGSHLGSVCPLPSPFESGAQG